MRKGQLSSSSTISLVLAELLDPLVSDELVVGEGGEGEIVGGQADHGRAAVLGQDLEGRYSRALIGPPPTLLNSHW